MKHVSFEIAKALKEAGYPQDLAKEEYLFDENGCPSTGFEQCEEYVRPTYLEVWLWLWREKGIKIVAEPRQKVFVYIKADFYALPKELASVFEDPEEAIEKAIEYLVDNDLIK